MFLQPMSKQAMVALLIYGPISHNIKMKSVGMCTVFWVMGNQTPKYNEFNHIEIHLTTNLLALNSYKIEHFYNKNNNNYDEIGC